MSITDFLKDNDNLGTREKIFIDRIRFDLKLAAAHASVPLQIFAPDVDRHGYDIIVDDADLERRFQLKSVLETVATAVWDIHKRLLRPIMDYAASLGFAHSSEGVGLGGGVILIKIHDRDPTCPVTYYYSDIFVLTALAEKLIVSAPDHRATQASDVLNRLRHGVGRERVPLPLGVFLKLRSAACLLSIGGFHSTEESYQWWGNLLIAFREGFHLETPPTNASNRAAAAQAKYAIEQLLSLTDEPGLEVFKSAAQTINASPD
jgi:hypothetical protein